MSETRFGLLGHFEILKGGSPVPIRSAAERALLVLLLLSPGQTVSATTLIDRLWAEETLPVDPMNALQLRVSKLRRTLNALELPQVERTPQGYRIDAAREAVDAELFAIRLRTARAMAGRDDAAQLDEFDAALDLWRGDALADFATEPWAVAESVRLHEMRGAAITERAQLAVSLGRHGEVIGHLEPLVAANPTQEAMAGLLMLAMYRAGRQAEALDVYSRTRSVLDEELGLEPSTSLRSLHERVLRQDSSLGAPDEVHVPVTATTLVPATGTRTAEQRSVQAVTNLPVQVSAPIGRDDDMDSLEQVVKSSRLVTLVGPGGAGKTTLGVATAARLVPAFADGVFLARLAPVRDGSAIATAIADGVGASLDSASSADDVTQRLLQYLHDRELLLLVDNCEHVIDEAATLVEKVLTHCPRVSVIATSREALAVSGEVQVPVGPLPTAPSDAPLEAIATYPASVLFLARARSQRPAIPLDDADLLALGRICRSLDGMPLALELAAARTNAMSLNEIAERLDQRFTLLTTGTRTAEDRQRTLRATVDWSYDLLTATERDVFERLSVFHGGWTLESANEVVAGSDIPGGDVLHSLARLVEQSLVTVEAGHVTRYKMLETLREYAAERLHRRDASSAYQLRHAQHFSDFTAREAAGLRGRDPRTSLRRLRHEYANITAAMAWFARDDDQLDRALRMAGALGLFWQSGRHLEGRDLLRQLLNRSGGSEVGRAAALQALSLVERPRACIVHPDDRCAAAARESLDIFDSHGQRSDAALSRVLLAVEVVKGEDSTAEEMLTLAEQQFIADADEWGKAVVSFVRTEAALKQGREEEAVRLGRQTASAFRSLDDHWGLSAVLYHLGWGLRQFGRLDEAARVLEEAIDVATGVRLDNTAGWAQADLGITHVFLDDLPAAREYFDRAQVTLDRVGDEAGRVLSTYGQALIDMSRGNWRAALTYFSEAAEGFVRLGTPVMQGQAEVGRARTFEALGEMLSASSAYIHAADLGQSAGEPAVTAAAWEGQARLADFAGDRASAEALNERARALRLESHRPSTRLDRIGSDSR